MEKEKLISTAIVSFWFNLFGVLAIPLFLMLGCNIVDYFTGLMASQYREEKISSYKSIKGIYKKVCMWLLVLVGSWFDMLIEYSIQSAGLDLQLPYIFATLVAVWLVVNEMISILENMLDAKVKIPPFLMPLAQKIKSTTELKAQKEVGTNEEGN